MTRRSWVQCPKTYKLIPKEEYRASEQQRYGDIFVQPDIEAFRSVVDGSVISSQRTMREHNKRNGVVRADEYPPEYYAQKARERADLFQGTTHTSYGRKLKADRIESIKAALAKHGVH